MMEPIERLIGILEVNFPTAMDKAYALAYTQTVPATSAATMMIKVTEPGWELHVKEIYADHRDNTSYLILCGEQKIEDNNEIAFLKPVVIQKGEAVAIKISNASASSQKYDYHLYGWLRRK